MTSEFHDSFFRAVFESRLGGIAIAEISESTVVEVNDILLEILGRERHEIIGVPFAWRDITPPEYHHLDQLALRQLDQHGHSDPFEKEYVCSDGTRTPVLVTASTVPGFPNKIIVFVNDLSSERRTEAALRESESRFQLMADSAPIMIWVNGPEGGCEFVNRAYLDFFGKSLDEVMHFGWVPASHPDDGDAHLKAYLTAVRERTKFEGEARFMRADGEYRWLHSIGVPRLSPTGEYLGHTGVSRDVTDQKQWEQHQRLLVGELNHRVKNTLAIAQSLAHQTFTENGNSPKDAIAAYEGRLGALASAHNLLTREKWEAVSLDELIGRALSPFCQPARCSWEGPNLRVHPKTAVTFLLAIHELATNASKYGALVNGSGRIEVRWQINASEFELVWRERAGPSVEEPSSGGFGSRMLRRALARELRGQVNLDFDPDGLVCRIRAPLTALEA